MKFNEFIVHIIGINKFFCLFVDVVDLFIYEKSFIIHANHLTHAKMTRRKHKKDNFRTPSKFWYSKLHKCQNVYFENKSSYKCLIKSKTRGTLNK